MPPPRPKGPGQDQEAQRLPASPPPSPLRPGERGLSAPWWRTWGWGERSCPEVTLPGLQPGGERGEGGSGGPPTMQGERGAF